MERCGGNFQLNLWSHSVKCIRNSFPSSFVCRCRKLIKVYRSKKSLYIVWWRRLFGVITLCPTYEILCRRLKRSIPTQNVTYTMNQMKWVVNMVSAYFPALWGHHTRRVEEINYIHVEVTKWRLLIFITIDKF